MKRKSVERKEVQKLFNSRFFVNAAGDKELPIVIGRAASPRRFEGTTDKSKPLGIPYSNAKAWMDSAIMSDILSKLESLFIKTERLSFFWIMLAHTPQTLWGGFPTSL